MEQYIVKKVLNNNVVIAEKNAEEFVIVGKAIGFNCHKGAEIGEDRVEGIFVKQSAKSNEEFNEVLKKINSEIIGISEEIISLCEKELGLKVSEAIHISLPDHINFAITRIKEGIKIENPFLNELEVLYPKEYKLAEKALEMINDRFQVNLPEDEIGFICMHINAAISEKNVSDTLVHTKKINEIMQFIFKLLKKKIDTKSLSYIRTITHLNFMIERILDNKSIKNSLLDAIKKEYYNEYGIAIKVAMKIEDLFSVNVPEDEIGYITLHINRIKDI
ncbi:transcription antiterminator BglG [Clostridium carboxidivorans P7]|uniref:Transcriptional antiterminator, BglG n=1 Tax=Clostridium carboxidivorans P7 TaxID=536227 RepID=C6PZJ3_9CLOT|nr:PRD domain-containing protein [Clostridium carboxidivorans]AKN32643.1 transcription antiterminator BglG [Clostridium carboxidivorans P7]EET85341.1 transcriptional antiterminator, BglG [Clostridium carboxidivorans P7]EFG90132.1 putative SacPA operon antiterminator [Clostridium carboxidivorans P7]